MKLSLLTLVAFAFFIEIRGAESRRHFSVNQTELSRLSSCIKIPSVDQMRQDLIRIYTTEKDTLTNRQRRNQIYSNGVNLDGLVIEGPLSRSEITDLNTLTFHDDTHNALYRKDFDVRSTREGTALRIDRSCSSPVCIERGIQDYSLSSFSGESPCRDILCAYDRIFGNPKGVMIAWAYKTQGLNLSKYSDFNGDDFNITNLRAAITSASVMPNHLREATTDDSFFRFKRGYTLALFGDSGAGVIANAAGAVFDPIDSYSEAEQVGTFIHEMGHRADEFHIPWRPWRDFYSDSDTDDWYQAAGWELSDLGDPLQRESNPISRYAGTNPAEDFAETFTLYRTNPRRLQRLSPSRYTYMREHVFDGIQYTSNLCEGSRADENPLPALHTPSGHEGSVE